MDLLIQLGVNYTLVIQLATFLFCFVVLKYFLFGPYYAAFNARKDRTLGKTEMAEKYIAEAKAMEEKFAARAFEVNERFREVFDKSRSEAVKEYDRLVGDARAKTKTVIDETTHKIHKEMEAARSQLSQEVAGVSQLINQKLIGKDLTT